MNKPASEKPWTRKLQVYDLRTNKHFTLKQYPLHRADLEEFVVCYEAENRHDRKPTWSEENQEGPGGTMTTTRSATATRRALTSSGCGMKAWRTPPTCLHLTSSRPRSPRT